MENRTKAIIGITAIIIVLICCLIYFALNQQNNNTELQVQIIQDQSQLLQQPGTIGTVTQGKGSIKLGEIIKSGISNALYSKSTMYLVILQNNGELQIRKGGLNVWQTYIYSPVDLKGCYAKLEQTGLVVRDPNDRIIWQMLPIEYIKAMNMKVNEMVIDDLGQLSLLDDQQSKIFTLDNKCLPAITVGTKLDNSRYIGSLTNDFCCFINSSGTFVQATAFQKYKDKSVIYKERELLMGLPANSGFTSIEISPQNKIIGKSNSKSDTVLIENTYLLCVNPNGDVCIYSSFNDYITSNPYVFVPCSDLCANSIQFQNGDGMDFVILKAPITIKSVILPYYLQISEDGSVTTTLQQLNQNKKQQISYYQGIQGFSSLDSNIVIVFGPIYGTVIPAPISMNTVYIGLIDKQYYDQRNPKLTYANIYDIKQVIPKQPMIGKDPDYLQQQAVAQISGFSLIVIAQQFDTIDFAETISIDNRGYLQLTDLLKGELVGPVSYNY